jgi:hypothetical protein
VRKFLTVERLKRKVAPHGVVIKPLKWLGYSLPPESKKIIGDLHWQEPGRMAQTMPVVSWLVRYETGANMKGLCRAAVLFGVISSSAMQINSKLCLLTVRPTLQYR